MRKISLCRWRAHCGAAIFIAAALAWAASSPLAATFVVNSAGNESDSSPGNGACNTIAGTCTLRAALTETQALGGSNTIQFSSAILPATIDLAGTQYTISSNLDIQGPGADQLIVQQAATPNSVLTRFFVIQAGANVSISGLTLRHARAFTSSIDSKGGAILNSGTLTATRCAFIDNTALGTNHPSTQVRFDAYGGAIYTDGPLTLDSCLFKGNSATATPGTPTQQGGSTFGGAICSDPFSNSPPAIRIINCTLSANTALAGANGGGGNGLADGGAIAASGNVAILSSTITLNEARADSDAAEAGGGLRDFPAAGAWRLRNTIVSGNIGGTINVDLLGAFDSGGCNIVGSTSGATWNTAGVGADGFSNTGAGDQVGANPMLAALADNGGPTDTHALQTGSPAINTGSCTEPNGATVARDQRGALRPQGPFCDIGAFEKTQPSGLAALIVDSTGDQSDYFAGDGVCEIYPGGPCTLRAAIEETNALAGQQDIIQFNLGSFNTIQIGSQLPAIADNLTIDGPGASSLRIRASASANNPAVNWRILEIDNGVTATIVNLTLQNGRVASGAARGGLILANGNLTLRRCILQGGYAIGANGASGGDGAGGAIFANGTLLLEKSVIESCSARGGNALTPGLAGGAGTGGAIAVNPFGAATVTIRNSTISGNTAIGGNIAGGSFYGAANGGGLALNDRGLIMSSTIAFNTASGPGGNAAGGGVYTVASGADSGPRIRSGIFSDNAADVGPDLAGNIQSSGYNLVKNAAGATIDTDGTGLVDGKPNSGTGNQIGVDPALQPLALNGGVTTTFTHAFPITSPAFNAGALLDPDGLNWGEDQRDVARPQNGAADIGAYELDFACVGGTSVFAVSNPSAIAIPASPSTAGPANPYPSTINVSGLAGSFVKKVVVALNGLSHTFPDDIDILLVAPDGRHALIMSDAGATSDLVGVDLMIDPEGATAIPDAAPFGSGTYAPANYDNDSSLPAPAPAQPYSANLAQFAALDGSSLEGVWSLYVYDDVTDDTGSIANGWSLNFTVCSNQTPSPTPTLTPTASLTPSPTPSQTPSLTASQTPSLTPSQTASLTPSQTPSLTASQTVSVSPTVTVHPSQTASQTASPTVSPSATPSPSESLTPSATPTSVQSATPSATPTPGPTETPSATPAATPTPEAPIIIAHPASQSAKIGQDVSFAVEAVGAGPLGYQWFKGIDALSGQTGATLQLADIAAADAGNYQCIVTNPWGSTPSNVATLEVLEPAAANAAQFIEQTLPAEVEADSTLHIGVTMKNTSALSWSAAQGYSLAVTGDPSGALQGASRIGFVLPDAVIDPGEPYQFIMEIRAPATPGTYTATLRMIEEGVEFFGDTVTLTINAVAPRNAASGWEVYE